MTCVHDGIIRDPYGKFISALSKNIGISSNNKDEMWAFFEGLKMARNLDITKFISESDSLFLILCVSRQDVVPKDLSVLLEGALKTLLSFDKVTLQCGYREIRGAADILAIC
ncbi:PREDICTED: uncharacterized protein LOC105976439 [Erythranthe guttata]|uniref:uncharacterized protein LOC105976439 n=1 Tax=Erythranthe guttata TaxID=4155 RepID=UPI00064DFEA2|nr:PREDICTED: uncharacterized protein LOC105976439 [Erythranthe guttata]|eukprot:XP_012857158.1 PREDICTED: uncharacterized protein LOC105976439 [Erythranthe guttata]